MILTMGGSKNDRGDLTLVERENKFRPPQFLAPPLGGPNAAIVLHIPRGGATVLKVGMTISRAERAKFFLTPHFSLPGMKH